MKNWTAEAAKKYLITISSSAMDFMALAYQCAIRSPERTQNGALVIVTDNTWSYGYNVNLWPTYKGYDFTVHAEEDAIQNFQAPLLLERAVLVSPWLACGSCARKIVKTGIKEVWRHKQRTCQELSNEWWDIIQDADTFMRDHGVTINEIDGPVPGPNVLIRNRSWSPEKLEYQLC